MKLMQLKLKPKLISAFLLVGLLPAAVIAILALQRSATSLEASAFDRLTGISDIKRAQVEKFFSDRQGDMKVLVGTVESLRNEAFRKLRAVQELKKNQIDMYLNKVMATGVESLRGSSVSQSAIDSFTRAIKNEGGKTGGEMWTMVEEGVSGAFLQAIEQAGYSDLFLVNVDGVVVYSAVGGEELGQNVLEGPLKDTGLARAFNATETDGIHFTDFSPYAPNGGEPSAFISGQVLNLNFTVERGGALIAMVSLDAINEIMHARTGLGKTGETFLVGPDGLMRSDSYREPTLPHRQGVDVRPREGQGRHRGRA